MMITPHLRRDHHHRQRLQRDRLQALFLRRTRGAVILSVFERDEIGNGMTMTVSSEESGKQRGLMQC